MVGLGMSKKNISTHWNIKNFYGLKLNKPKYRTESKQL